MVEDHIFDCSTRWQISFDMDSQFMVECQEKNTEICYVGDLKEFVGVTEITS